MPSNIEIKAALNNRTAAEAVAVRLSYTSPVTICQEDILFRCGGTRLKLRIFGAGRGELIRYERKDIAAAPYSRYLIARTLDPQVLQRS